jgi:polyhydroxyalkanoate synthesis regulator phasin
MAQRLKVFRTTNGLTESAVAVSSRPKALEAWGSKADLFKEGLASETDDPALTEAALVNPGKVVTRSALGADALSALKAATKSVKKPAAVKVVKPVPKRGPPPALLERVRRLEQRLSDLQDKRQAEKAEFVRRRAQLEQEEADAKASFKRKRRELEAELDTARAAVRAEGG